MAGVQGQLGSQTDIENMWGVEAVRMWSNPSGVEPTTPANPATITAAINYADSYIGQRLFTAGNYATPLNPQGVSTGSVTQWFAAIAGNQLEQARGINDVKQMRTVVAYKRAISEVQFYAAGTGANRLSAGYRWPVGDSPTTY